jgi:hypothetical protein
LAQQRSDASRRLYFGQVDRQLDFATVLGANRVPEPLEQVNRLRVVREHRGFEAADPLLARALDERVEQPGPSTPALPVVHDHHRRLGHIRAGTHVARHADAIAGSLLDRHERLVVAVVDAGEIVQVAFAEVRDGPEEPPVARLRAEPLEPVRESRTVIGLDGPDHDARPVTQLRGPDRHDQRTVRLAADRPP